MMIARMRALPALSILSAVDLGCSVHVSTSQPADPAEDARRAVQITAVGSSSCALRAAGTVACWGAPFAAEAADVDGIADAVEISLGNAMLCFRRAPGSVACAPIHQEGVGPFAPVEGLDDATSLSQGESHACALRSGGGVACWGNNDYGQLGDGTFIERTAAVPVVGLEGAVQVSAGDYATCARLGDGTARCWGRAYAGQLGDGAATHEACMNATETCSSTPVVVEGLDDLDAVSAGLNGAIARHRDGRVVQWGWALGGASPDSPPYVSLQVTDVPGARGALSLHAGYLSNYAVTPVRDLVCWGGCWTDGDTSAVPKLEPTAIEGVHQVAAVASGWYHACALVDGGHVVCWGGNQWHQLGDGTTTPRSAPGEVAGL